MPTEQNKIDLMQEIYRILIEWLRKQASTVMLLSFALAVLWKIGNEQLRKHEEKIHKQEVRIDGLIDEVRKCDMERAALQVEIRALQFQVQVMVPVNKQKK